ncbi:MAG: tetratricopeptide repeat protein, partial [Pseudomonadota bacterium]
MSLFEELKRRNVVRIATLYVVASWVILQVADILFDAFELPASANRLVIIVLLLGFPVALIMSWVYELTPEGVKRESEIDRNQSVTGQTGRKINGLIVGLLVLAIVMLGANLLAPGRSAQDVATRAAVDELSIAVLPFANRSANADDVYFVDGVHDDILTQLVRIGSLTVTSRTSVERFRDTTLSIPEIAAQLGVRHILEGGIQRAGNRVRINLQLINANNDDHLWAETYERELTAANIFDVQADIARAVTSALSVTLQRKEEAALAERPTDSIEAYDLYLLGRFHWNKRTPDAIELSQGYFERATQTDPDYVLAYSGLADSYSLLVDYGNLPGEEGFLLAQAAIDKAMELDDSLSEVWASLGLLRLQQDRDQDAIDALQKAIDLDEKNFWAWSWYGTVVQGQRRFREAQSAMESAYALEPMAIPVNNNLAVHYEYQGDFVRARQHYERVAELRPETVAEAKTDIAETFQAEGRLANAIQDYRELLSVDASNIRAMSGLGQTYLLLGDTAEASAWYARLTELASLTVSKYRLFEARGDFDAALIYLEDYLVRVGARQDIEA